MKLKDILKIIKNNTKVALCYVGDKDYALTTKEDIYKSNVLDNKVKSIGVAKIRKSPYSTIIIKIFKEI